MERRGRLERALGIQLTAGPSRWKTPRFQAWPTGHQRRGLGRHSLRDGTLEELGRSLSASSAPALKWTPRQPNAILDSYGDDLGSEEASLSSLHAPTGNRASLLPPSLPSLCARSPPPGDPSFAFPAPLCESWHSPILSHLSRGLE